MQRFGRLGKRNSGASLAKPAELQAAAEAAASSPSARKKDPRCMYLSLDEACTHVNAAAFRLVAGIYDATGATVLATAVSPPIRCAAWTECEACTVPGFAVLPCSMLFCSSTNKRSPVHPWMQGGGQQRRPQRRSHHPSRGSPAL